MMDEHTKYDEVGATASTQALISERERTHGVFRENSRFMQKAKVLMRMQPNWSRMEDYQREALDMIAHKMGRILHGDPSHVDHWDDVAGYAAKVSQTIGEDTVVKGER